MKLSPSLLSLTTLAVGGYVFAAPSVGLKSIFALFFVHPPALTIEFTRAYRLRKWGYHLNLQYQRKRQGRDVGDVRMSQLDLHQK